MKPIEEWGALRLIATAILVIALIGFVAAGIRSGAIFGNGDCGTSVGPDGQSPDC